MKKGATIPLPSDIEPGLVDLAQRTGWNRSTPEEFALPNETWRETIDRHQRYRNTIAKLGSGEVNLINDLVALNLNIRQFAQDAIQFCEGPELLRAIWKAVEKVSILDPTCGSGAFLFAALNILKPLYEACLQRMQGFLEDMEVTQPHSSSKFSDFRQILEESKRHPKQDYFILKAIIINNLFGVDIMEEAVEICKLRLFLKLVAQVESQDRIEPLPDIDFNIRGGNTFLGYARLVDIRPSRGIRTDEENDMLAKIEDKALILDAKVRTFRVQQTQLDGTVLAEDKAKLSHQLSELDAELNTYLSGEYGVKQSAIQKWTDSHKPFHWFCDFHERMSSGGFDVIIGNPPYIELRELGDTTLRGYKCIDAGNIYAVAIERCIALSSPSGRLGFIVPVSSVSTDRYETLQNLLAKRGFLVYSSFDDRPSRLFDGLEHIRLTVHLFTNGESSTPRHFSTRYNKWSSDFRPSLFSTLAIHSSMPMLVPGSLPKLCSHLEMSLLEKLKAQTSSFGYFIRKSGAHSIFYSRKVGYFLQVLNFEPRVIDGRGNKRPPSEFKPLNFDSRILADIALCSLNSSLFYWFITIFSDCRHINKREVEAFPIQLSQLSSGHLGKSLSSLASELMADLKANSEERTMRFAHDTLTVQCIFPKHSKGIIDKIDHALAEHFGFTDQELDFIVNYDIKYRLGADADEDEE